MSDVSPSDANNSVTQDIDPQTLLRAKLNAETGKLAWADLQRHFARGVVIKVAVGLDLVDVAVAVSNDDKQQVEAWMHAGHVQQATTQDAQTWHAQNSVLWAIVTAPWVLVQDIVVQN
jgi:hypothetical protein